MAASSLPALPVEVIQQHILPQVPFAARFATRGACRALRDVHDSSLVVLKLALPISAYATSSAVPSELASLLSRLPNLRELHCGGLISDATKRRPAFNIAALTGLSRLTSLQLSDLNVYSVEPLRHCTALVRVELQYCTKPQVLRHIGACTALTHLTVLQCCLTQLPNLSGCSGLTHLNLGNERDWCIVGDASALRRCRQLTGSKLCSNKRLKNIRPLALCAGLAHLDLSETGVDDLSPLRPCQQLTSLRVDGCESLRNIDALAHLTSLQHISATWLPIVSVAGLEACQQLKSLNLHYCSELVDIGPLQHCQQLTLLDLSDCWRLVDIGPLKHLLSLIEVDLEHTAIASIAALGHCTRLATVVASHCSVYAEDVSPLAACTQLTRLEVMGWSPHLDVSTLVACTHLKVLSIPYGARGLEALYSTFPHFSVSS